MKLEDLYQNLEPYDVPESAYQNLLLLHPKLCALEEAFGAPLIVTSGFRTWAMHREIYRRINDQRLIQQRAEVPVPLHSTHLTGQAADISDPDKKLQSFLEDEIFLTDNGLWAEGFKWTPGWAHLQIKPYGSWKPGGSHFFKPF